MSPEYSALNAEMLHSALPDWNLVFRDCITSTNDEAGALAAAGAPQWTAVMAEEQTAGRGRRGAQWVSPARRNALVSVIVRPGPALPPDRWARLTLAAALAGCDALDGVPGLAARAMVKWPNDLFLSGRKVAGILVESAGGPDGGYVIIGTGFNLNLIPAELPEEIRTCATSVWIERGGLPVGREAFVAAYLNALVHRCRQAANDFGSLKGEIWERSSLAGGKVELTSAGKPFEGVVTGLGPEGELVLETPGKGSQTFASAEGVRLVGK